MSIGDRGDVGNVHEDLRADGVGDGSVESGGAMCDRASGAAPSNSCGRTMIYLTYRRKKTRSKRDWVLDLTLKNTCIVEQWLQRVFRSLRVAL